MKKILSLLLISTIGILLFTSCSVINQEKTNIVDSFTETPFNPPKHKMYKHINGNIKQETIFNEKGIKITTKGFDFSDTEPKFIFYIENNSKYTYEFNSKNVAVNNFMVYAKIEEKVLSGEKKEIAMKFLDNELFTQRIETIEDISFEINMTRIGKKQKEYTTGEILLSTDLKANELEEITNGQKIVNDENVKITYLDMEHTEENTILYFLLENRGTQEIIVSAPRRKAEIGNKTVEISFNHDILPYKNKIAKLVIKNENLQDIDKSKITSLSTELMIFDKRTHATILKIGKITVNDLQKTIINKPTLKELFPILEKSSFF